MKIIEKQIEDKNQSNIILIENISERLVNFYKEKKIESYADFYNSYLPNLFFSKEEDRLFLIEDKFLENTNKGKHYREGVISISNLFLGIFTKGLIMTNQNLLQDNLLEDKELLFLFLIKHYYNELDSIVFLEKSIDLFLNNGIDSEKEVYSLFSEMVLDKKSKGQKLFLEKKYFYKKPLSYYFSVKITNLIIESSISLSEKEREGLLRKLFDLFDYFLDNIEEFDKIPFDESPFLYRLFKNLIVEPYFYKGVLTEEEVDDPYFNEDTINHDQAKRVASNIIKKSKINL